MHSTSNYQLYVLTQELDGDESFARQCGILIDIVERDMPANFDVDKAPVPVLLDHASGVLRRLWHHLVRLRYTLRVALPRQSAPRPPEPMTLVTARDVDTCIAQLVARSRDESIYRTETWFIPGGQANGQALAAIQGFEVLNKDVGLFDKAVGLGAMRLSLEMSNMTLHLACSEMAEATEWIKDALEDAPLPVRWALTSN